jgi:hypothetical protein
MVNAWFHVDIRHMCDHRVDASMNTMKIPNMVHTMVGWTEMSPWMSSRNWSGSSCMLRCEGLKIGFPVVAHEVHTHFSEGIWTRGSCDQWNCFICNMFYGLDARVVQSKRQRVYFFKYLFLIHQIVSRRNLYIELKNSQDWNLSQIYRTHTILFISKCWCNIYNNINGHE